MIKVFIGQPPEFPVVRERGVMLEPGLEHFVEISSYTATTDSGAEALDVKYRWHQDLNLKWVRCHYFTFRQCFTPDEGDLAFHSIYTYSSCTFECKLKVIITLQCIHSMAGLKSFVLRKQRSRQDAFPGIFLKTLRQPALCVIHGRQEPFWNQWRKEPALSLRYFI